MRFLTYILLVIAVVRVTGLDIAIAQMDAWVSMIHERSEKGLYIAVESTFSGKAPCSKCLSLEQERKERDTPHVPGHTLSEKFKLPLASENPRESFSLRNATLTQEAFIPPNALRSLINAELDPPPPRLS